jgi:hypothetical protein
MPIDEKIRSSKRVFGHLVNYEIDTAYGAKAVILREGRTQSAKLKVPYQIAGNCQGV